MAVRINPDKKAYREQRRLYYIWHGMIDRTEFIGIEDYKHYANIRVCAEWYNFAVFREWAINNGYTESLTIDRINNSGNYEPDNCRWATMTEQARNRRTSRLETIDGVTKTFAEWLEIYDAPRDKVRSRIRAGKMNFQQALEAFSRNKTIRGAI